MIRGVLSPGSTPPSSASRAAAATSFTPCSKPKHSTRPKPRKPLDQKHRPPPHIFSTTSEVAMWTASTTVVRGQPLIMDGTCSRFGQDAALVEGSAHVRGDWPYCLMEAPRNQSWRPAGTTRLRVSRARHRTTTKQGGLRRRRRAACRSRTSRRRRTAPLSRQQWPMTGPPACIPKTRGKTRQRSPVRICRGRLREEGDGNGGHHDDGSSPLHESLLVSQVESRHSV